MGKVVQAVYGRLSTATPIQMYGLKASSAKALALSPVVILVLYVVALLSPPTHYIARLTLEEGNLVETLTFVFLLLGGVWGLALVWRMRKRSGMGLAIGFYTLFSVCLLFVAGEEVAWGQQFLGFETPSGLAEVNQQGEVTLHNVHGLKEHLEFYRLAFGLGGLLGVLASFYPPFRNIGAPAVLLPWFFVITVVSAVDFFGHYFYMVGWLDYTLRKIDELVEMMIGASGLLFVWLNTRMLSFYAKNSSNSRQQHRQQAV